MFTLRTLARSVPRTVVSRSYSQLARPSFATSLNTLRSSSSPAILRPCTAALPRLTQYFSTSTVRFDSTSDELHNKLGSEIDIEMDTRQDDLAGSLQEYLDNSEFAIEDVQGQEEVKLTKKYNDETITITFSVADINNPDMEADMDGEDAALFDEEAIPEEGQSGGANTKGAVNQGRTAGGNFRVAPEDHVAPADRPELAEEMDGDAAAEGESQAGFPARMTISIERPSKGALGIEAIAQDGAINIENVYFYTDGKLANAKTAEQDWSRRGMYLGPPFANLDEDLQDRISEYLEARGVNTSLALFVPDYIDYKEQKEYTQWLQNFKAFVE